MTVDETWTYDPDLYESGIERVFYSCAAWLQGISRHQIREVQFDALVAGTDFLFRIETLSDGRVRGTVVTTDGRYDIVWTGVQQTAKRSLL
jgi:hypothetical protein